MYKMSLEQLVNNAKTDKNTLHSYLPLYQKLLEGKQETARNVLEIGIQSGGSIQLWNAFFPNATVHGVDVMHISSVWESLKNNNKIVLHTSMDAYDEKMFNKTFLTKGVKYDFILDDGPHTLESMKQFIRLYSKILTDDGILIIEDVQSMDWIDALVGMVPAPIRKHIKVYDLRSTKQRYDDIVFTIDMSSNSLPHSIV